LSLTLFEKRPISQVFSNQKCTIDDERIGNQLELFNL
jgi:hypothetical protein